MTAVADQIPFEALDDPDHRTANVEALIKQRGTEDERRLIPRGTYEATLLEATIVRRKDGGGFVIRMIARTDHRGVYLTSWRGLSTDPVDPYVLTDNQVKSLRKFAEGMAIAVPAPAPVVVAQLQAVEGHAITARVVHTPAGIQSTFTRATSQTPPSTTLRVAGRVIDVDGVLIDDDQLEGRAKQAQDAHLLLLRGIRTANEALRFATEGCYRLQKSEGWLALGYETLGEYLAAPEITMSRSEFFRLADIWESYVLDGGMDPALLGSAGPSKLEVPLPALKQGVVSAEQAVADAEAMPRNDLRAHYREMLGDESELEKPSTSLAREQSPAGGTDDALTAATAVDEHQGGALDPDELVRWAEMYGHPEGWAKKAQAAHGRAEEAEQRAEAWKNDSVERLNEIAELKAQLEQASTTELPGDLDQVMAAAKGAVAALRRVMVEVGDPKQKRMGKELRFVVEAALQEADVYGLGE